MQGLINEAELRALDLSGVRSILDVGAGLAQMSRALARAAGPAARVVAIERDPRQIEEARRQAAAAGEEALLEIRAGSAEDLPLRAEERGTFDLAHARFLLEHIPDPLAVVREMVAAVRPGGRIVLVDDDHELLRTWPPLPALMHAWETYWRSYARHGCDPLVGRRLAELLHDAGAAPHRVTAVFYGACRGMEVFDPVVENLRGVLRSAADGLAEAGLFSADDMRSALAATEEWSRHPAATIWYSLPLAEGRVN